MAFKNSIKAIPYTSVASSALTASYQPINPNGLPDSCFLLKINNFGSTIIIISYDGVTDHDQIYSSSTMAISAGLAASVPNNYTALWPKGQIVYVKGTAGTGAVTLCGYYQPSAN
jgi:hypothetical protein